MITRILVADDESVVRMSLHTIVNWQSIGCEIVGNAQDGYAAMEILRKTPVDVLLTDIRMPGMDGIELLKKLQDLENPPVPVVLSAYEDFPYVRQAFKLGVQDYILKSELTAQTLMDCVLNIAKRSRHPHGQVNLTIYPSEKLRMAALGKSAPDPELFSQPYMLAGFEVDDFANQAKRYGGNIENDFIRPMIHYAEQVPRVASRCHICGISQSRYLLLFPVEGQLDPEEKLKSISEQIARNWKNNMNVCVSIGVGGTGTTPEDFERVLDTAWENLSIKLVLGRGNVYLSEHQAIFSPEKAKASAEDCRELADLILDGQLSPEAQARFSAKLCGLQKKEAIDLILALIYTISLRFIEAGDDVLFAFDKSYDYHEKLSRLETMQDLEIWLGNFLRWLADYVEKRYSDRQVDVIKKAKRFIEDNYCDSAISLAAVADFVGFSEKYFSTRFSKEYGKPFSVYLNELRISKAKELMEKTDLRVYEICDKIGFNNVEHFNRVFKKMTGLTPSGYKQSK
ncbi:MAG: response regulator [Clostridiales bacterium]|jgi:YesN/AraC family two-component response regulator|nr:response regulator [Clostridiales bacterium]